MTPIRTKIGPRVIPKNPNPNGSLSNVIIKNPMIIHTKPATKTTMFLAFKGKLDCLFDAILNQVNM